MCDVSYSGRSKRFPENARFLFLFLLLVVLISSVSAAYAETNLTTYTSTQTAQINESVTFYAHYTNDSIPITHAVCTIAFDDLSAEAEMQKQEGADNYTFTRTFSSAGNKGCKITCNHSEYAGMSGEEYVMIYPAFETYTYCRDLPGADRARLVLPEELEYKGAFRLPKTPDQGSRWGYGGKALTYYPGGDPEGAGDGYPGSLFGSGHVYHNLVSEVAIPVPVAIPQTGDISDLNIAETLQPFADITCGIKDQLHEQFNVNDFGGLAYLPAQGSQTTDKLYWNFFQYYNVANNDYPSHGYSELNLSDPKAEGAWHIGPYEDSNYSAKRTTNYMFDVPRNWGDAYLNGAYLLTGRGDGCGSAGNSHGPPLYSFAPYLKEATPPQNASINSTILLMYPPSGDYFPDWSPCDVWEGGVWLASGDRSKSAVLSIGRKGLGQPHYGGPRPGDCGGSKGYHCDPYETQFLFYDTDELAEVARGEREYYNITPYAIFIPEEHFLLSCSGSVGGAAFDRERGLLYVVQQNQENPVVHVYDIASGEAVCGDLNRDGDVTSADVLIALMIAVGSHEYTNAADLNCDGCVTALDAQLLLHHLFDPDGYPLNCGWGNGE